MCYITCTVCEKRNIAETRRRLGDRFRKYYELSMTEASKRAALQFNLPDHSSQQMTACGVFLHQGNTESREI